MTRSLLLNPSLPLSISASVTVVSATRQAASALGVPYQSLETLAQNTLPQQGLTMASPLVAQRLLRQAISQTYPTQDSEGTACMVLPTVKTLLRSGVNLTAFLKLNSPRLQKLAQLTINYQDVLRTSNLIDSSELFWQVTKFPSIKQPFLFYGYFHPRPDQLAWIDAITAEGSILALPYQDSDLFSNNREAIEYLQPFGWEIQPSCTSTAVLGEQLQQAFLGNATVTDGVQLHAYPTVEAEVRGALKQVKTLLSQGISPQEIVLIARDERFYSSTLLDVAWEYDLPLNVSYDFPLVETRIGDWLSLLLEVVETDYSFETTARLFNHPLANTLTPQQWKAARSRYPNTRQAWEALGLNLKDLNLPQQDRRDKWVQRLQAIFNHFQLSQRSQLWTSEQEAGGKGAGSRGNAHHPLPLVEAIAFSQLQAALIELSKPENARISLKTFIQEVREMLALSIVIRQPEQDSVELHNLLSVFGAKYRHVFVLGTVEGLLSYPLENDPNLDYCDRKSLAQQGFPIETAVRQAQREAIAFYTLLQVPTLSLTFSYPRLIGRDATFLSPFVTRLGLTPTPISLQPFASLEEVRRHCLQQESNSLSTVDPIINHILHAWQVEQRRESSVSFDEYDGVVGLPLSVSDCRFSASQLTQLGQCPFKWFASRLLRLQELPEAHRELPPSLRGQLYHRCLELALLEVKTVEDLQKIDLDTLNAAFLQAEKDLDFLAFPGWDNSRGEHLAILQLNFTESSFLTDNSEILDHEIQFEAQWYGLSVTGKIDRLDRTPSGLVILDYKVSSQAPLGIQDETGKASIDLQLPLYKAAIAQRYPQDTIADAAYYSLTQRKPLRPAKRDEGALAAFAERVKWHLEQGNYAVAPDIDQKACNYCSFDLVCRRGTRLSRKQNNE